MRMLSRSLAFLLFCQPAVAQEQLFVGALLGVATLSADATSSPTPTLSVSQYKPENGTAVNVLAGLHSTDWLSFQGNLIWNRNAVETLSARFPDELRRDSYSVDQVAGIFDAMVYFRSRASGVRPYLSVGTGVVRLTGGELADTNVGLRVAVGLDLRVRSAWWVRYSFSETLSENLISRSLRPPATRNLANFQNLFGLVRRF